MDFLNQFRAAPNLLTLLRLFIIPFLVIAILDGRYHLAFALFILAGFSDGFDGLLARMLSQRTTLGQYLDPCLLYTSPSPRDATLSRMPSSA